MDSPRLLASASERGYTSSALLALRNEPEAVSVADVEYLAERSHAQAHAVRIDELTAHRTELERRRDYHTAQARHAERQLRRVNRKL